MISKKRVETLMLVVIVITATGLASGQTHKEYRFAVHPGSSVSVANPYGAISVKSAAANTVVVTAILHSDKVEIDQIQHGNRIDITSHLLPGADAESGQVEYEISVPADASVNMRTSTGPLKAEKMGGDLTLEGTTASVDVHDVSNAHVHVKTLSGPVTLSNIKGGHVEVTSVSGDVTLNTVTGPTYRSVPRAGKLSTTGTSESEGPTPSPATPAILKLQRPHKLPLMWLQNRPKAPWTAIFPWNRGIPLSPPKLGVPLQAP